MPRYSLTILGLEITFKTDANQDRIDSALKLLEERYGEFGSSVSNVSKEKLLTCLAFSLADDYLESKSALARLEEKIENLLEQSGKINGQDTGHDL